jgi:hypothetical protein
VDENEREEEAQSVFVVYSLQTHQVVKMRPMPGLASDFKANQNFIVIVSTFSIYVPGLRRSSNGRPFFYTGHYHTPNVTYLIFNIFPYASHDNRGASRAVRNPRIIAYPFPFRNIYYKRNIQYRAIDICITRTIYRHPRRA